MKKIILTLVCLLWAVPALCADPAIDFMDKLAKEIIEKGLLANKTTAEKETFFRDKFTANLDLKNISQMVLGVYWKKATDQEKKDFMEAFTDLTTKTWTDRFGLYQGQDIVFQGTRNAPQKNQLYVDSKINDNPPIEVIWRLRQKDGNYKIVDIVVEDVSMVMSYRNEYTAFLQQHQGSVQALIDELKTKSKEFKYAETK
ncbi:MAG: phospholipid-binding protein MlaC [Alphaproteobacteria bacterium]